jgi:hypothetical protein
MDHGHATTKETLIAKKGNVTYHVDFEYPFYYDYSNGIIPDEYEIDQIITDDGTVIMDNEKKLFFKSMIKQIINKR